MHSRYGYKGRYTPITQTDFKILEDFHNYIDDSCKWMAERWIDLLRPLQKGSYRQMYTTCNNRLIERQLDREEEEVGTDRCIQHVTID